MEHDSLIEKKEDFNITTRFGEFRLRAYKQTTNRSIHIALTKGDWNKDEKVLTRINSAFVNNDVLGTLTKDVSGKLEGMFNAVNNEGKGAIIFINQDFESLNLLSRLSEYKELQKQGIHKAPKIEMDNRDFGIGAQILHDLNITKMRMLTNRQQTKRVGIVGYGLEIVEYVPFY